MAEEALKTFEKGSLGRALAIGKLASVGFGVAIPIDDHLRYDLVVDRDSTLYRVQVKTVGAPADSAAILVPLVSTPLNHRTRKVVRVKYEPEEVDAILVCWLSANRWFWLPVELLTKESVTLRFAPTLNRQRDGVHWGVDYEI